jgi:hypothetical protein
MLLISDWVNPHTQPIYTEGWLYYPFFVWLGFFCCLFVCLFFFTICCLLWDWNLNFTIWCVLFCGTRVWTQDFTLAKQSTLLWLFWKWVLKNYLPGLALYFILLISASQKLGLQVWPSGGYLILFLISQAGRWDLSTFFFLSETGSDYVAQVDLQLLIPQPQPPECWMTGECHHSRLHLLFLCGEVELTAVPIYVFFLTI